ncbi:MAG: T9SS type A sorting domain-containing protein, partial [Bacteroidetes bacterium]|nr:T9SS type A sorting domain-containing protein [Bacteroidota bacterium]
DDFIGEPLQALRDADCSDISVDSIVVTREEANAGTIGIDVVATNDANENGTLRIDGEFEISLCVDGSADPIIVFHETPSENLTYKYVITDVNTGNILGFADTNEINLDGAGVGVCAIWGWSYRGLNQDDFIGEPLQTLRDADCSDISEDSIVVNRLEGEDCNVLAIGDLETTDFSLFPNPAENSVNISLNTNEAVTAQINIYDVAGRLVVQQRLQTQATLDVSRLQSGTYLVHLIDSATGSTTTKQMIKR